MANVSGMAAQIRAASESETFDLGGQNITTITNTIHDAFKDPLRLQEMIRITFVTGAGKQARQRYDEGAAKAVTASLRGLGFSEDRGASCVIECAGSFKLQHDTGKNQKTVVVFPNITGLTESGATVDGDGHQSNLPPLLEEGSPEQLIASSTMNVFKNMLTVKCPSWSQKKGCLHALESIRKLLENMDAKLLKGTPLSDPEQYFYDSLSSLDDKEALVKTAMHDQVELGNITKFERDTLLAQNADRLATLQKEILSSNGNKLTKLQNMKAKVEQRRELLESIEVCSPHKLRHEVAIRKLRKEL